MPAVERRIHASQDSRGRAFFIWGAVTKIGRRTLVAASCWTQADAKADFNIWSAEYAKDGDRDAAFDRVCAARETRRAAERGA